MKLSKREQEILVRVAYGLTDKEIAMYFGISIRTVQTHISSRNGCNYAWFGNTTFS